MQARRWTVYTVSLAMIVSLFSPIFITQTAKADSTEDMLKKAARIWVGLRYLSKHHTGKQSISKDDAGALHYFSGFTGGNECQQVLGILIGSKGGQGYLKDSALVCKGLTGTFYADAFRTTLFNALGVDSSKFLVGLGFTDASTNSSGSYEGHSGTGNGNFEAGTLDKYLMSRNDIWPASLGSPNFEGGILQWVKYVDLIAGITGYPCAKNTNLFVNNSNKGPNDRTVYLFSPDTGDVGKYYVQPTTGANSSNFYGWVEENKTVCYNAVNRLEDASLANAYKAIYQKSKADAPVTCKDKYPTAPDLQQACENGLKNASDPNYCATTYPTATDAQAAANQDKYNACQYGNSTALQDDGSPHDGSTDSKDGSKSCGLQNALGWIICPVMNFMADALDSMFDFLADNFLSVNASTVDPGGGAEKAWSQFRDYANVVFVIAFMIIVYSQITGAGISNYGIKRMLPRLIMTALLVNISFIICQFAVDISNILGYGLHSVMNNIAGNIQGAGGDVGVGNGGAKKLIAGILVVGTIAVVVLGLGILIPALLAVGLIFIILIVRKALIVILIVISPLAFVAYLLPNTEKWFKRWGSMLVQTLMVFPVIAVVFGGTKIASAIIATTDAPSNAGDGQSSMLSLVALGVLTAPLFIVPTLLKKSLSAAGAIGAKFEGWSNRANSNFKSKSKQAAANSYPGRIMAERKKMAATRNAMIAGGTYTGRNPLRRLRSRASRGLNGITGTAGDRLSTMGAALEDKEFNDEVSAAAVGISQQSAGEVLSALQSGAYKTEAEKAAAIDHIMSKGSFNERRKVVEGADQHNARTRKRISDGVYAKGDQNIYGSGIGASIAGGSIGGAAGLRQKTLDNIEGGHVSAEHLVQGEGSAQYLIDVAKGQEQQVGSDGKGVVDSSGNRVLQRSSVAGSSIATGALSNAASEARTNTRTRPTATAGAFAAELGRL